MVNKVNNFDADSLGFTESLRYLNIRDNKVDKLEEIVKLTAYTALETLITIDNPFVSKNEDYNENSLLKHFKYTKRVNKTEINVDLLKEVYEFEKAAYEEEKRLEEEKRRQEELAEEEQEED